MIILSKIFKLFLLIIIYYIFIVNKFTKTLRIDDKRKMIKH